MLNKTAIDSVFLIFTTKTIAHLIPLNVLSVLDSSQMQDIT